jgi:hypothetical protein
MNVREVLCVAALSAAVAAVSDAHASQRRFTYTYESGTLTRGQVELEPWTTFRIGKEDYYARVDQRVEFEVGLTNRLQTSFYLNMHGVTAQADSSLETDFQWDGFSNEWKLKLRDPVADPFGLALYFEWGASTSEVELEAKVIADKRAGNFLLAFNAGVEPEWEFEIEHGTNDVVANDEFNFEFDLAGAYFVSHATSVGIEVRNHNLHISSENYQHSALFAGPVVSYASEAWWATLTVLPQIAKLQGSEVDAGNRLVLSELEKLEVRLMLGVDL